MLKKTITYKDFNDQVSEDFFFISMAEMVELELSHKDGLSASYELSMPKMVKVLLPNSKHYSKSYGKRSDDGRRFVKSQEIRDEFQSTEHILLSLWN